MNQKYENKPMGWRRIIAFVLVAILALQPLATGQSVFAATNQQDTNDTYQNGDDTYITEDDTDITEEDMSNSLLPDEDGAEAVYTDGCGHYELVMPTGTASTYQVVLTITTTPGYTLTYPVTLDLQVGDGVQSVEFLPDDGVGGWSTLTGVVSNIAADTTIRILNITENGAVGHNTLPAVYIQADVASTDMGETLTVTPAGPQKIVAGTTTTVNVDSEGATADGWNPFKALGQDGTLMYLLNNYNVVSKYDIVATHIVGPIIAQRSGYRTVDDFKTLSLSDRLAASDYTRGIPSYIGVPVGQAIINTQTGKYQSYVGITYNIDVTMGKFTTDTRPNFYMRETLLDGSAGIETFDNNSSLMITDGNYQDISIINTQFDSPNGVAPSATSIYGQTYQNDGYIDFDTLYAKLIAESRDLMDTGSLEGTTDVIEKSVTDADVVTDGSGVTTMTLEGGKSYKITNADGLDIINIDMPGEYGFFDNPCPIPTIISFEQDTINATATPSAAVDVVGEAEISQLPTTYINGAAVGTPGGLGGEYDDLANKIIWNFPNLTGAITPNITGGGTTGNIAGHVVAPQAAFWSMDAQGGENGGNLNGTGIFANFHSGEIESHLFTYNGFYEKSVSLELKAEKKLIGASLKNEQFEFILEPVGDTHDGVVVTGGFPAVAKNTSGGKITFPTMSFNKAGTYEFIVEEIPGNDASITYDKSEYTATIVIRQVNKTNAFNQLYTTYEVESITYTKDDGSAPSEMVFTNTAMTTGTVKATVAAMKKLVDEETKANLNLHIGQFHFELTGAEQAGLDTQLPLQASNHIDGTVTFADLVFSQSGTYYFTMQEIVPTPGAEGVTYDDEVYAVTITVTEAAVGTMEAVVTYTNKAGETVEQPSVLFTNIKKSIPKTVDYGFTKVNESGELLEGAKFAYIKVTDKTAEVTWEGATEVTSNSDGEVLLENLTYDDAQGATYYFKEIQAPTGYARLEGYWQIDIDENGVITVTEMMGAPAIAGNNPQIINQLLTVEPAHVDFLKTDPYGKLLKGAEFSVVQVESLDKHDVDYPDATATTVTSGKDGALRVDNLLIGGVYRITETKAPIVDGNSYILPSTGTYWVIEILGDAVDPTIYTVNVYPVQDGVLGQPQAVGDGESYPIINYNELSLPTTGGMGTTWFAIIGLFMLCTAGLLFNTVRKTEHKKWR